jgi:S-adenosylmethionine synthetase
VARPVSMLVQTFGTGTVSDDILSAAVAQVFDARPGMLTQELDLRRPIFKKTAAYGHFGRSEPEFTWEKTPKLDALRDAVSGPAPKATKKK